MSYVEWMDNNPQWFKILLCIPCLHITWIIYRLVKCYLTKRWTAFICWILADFFLGWLIWAVDLISNILGNPVLFF